MACLKIVSKPARSTNGRRWNTNYLRESSYIASTGKFTDETTSCMLFTSIDSRGFSMYDATEWCNGAKASKVLTRSNNVAFPMNSTAADSLKPFRDTSRSIVVQDRLEIADLLINSFRTSCYFLTIDTTYHWYIWKYNISCRGYGKINVFYYGNKYFSFCRSLLYCTRGISSISLKKLPLYILRKEVCCVTLYAMLQ